MGVCRDPARITYGNRADDLHAASSRSVGAPPAPIRGLMMANQTAIEALNPEPFGTFRPSWLWRLMIGRSDLGKPAKTARSGVQHLRSRLKRHCPVFDIVHEGVKLRLYPAENLCDRKLVLNGTHSVHEEIETAAPYLSRATVLVDIGANIGLYTLFARKLMPASARIVAFEPHPRTVRKLRQNLDLNGADNVTAINAAVGARNETLSLFISSPTNAGRNTMLQTSDDPGEAPAVEVPVRPLLDVLHEQGVDHIDVLKIDVEGFEAEALAPFFDTADPGLLPGYIMIEVKSRDQWQVDLIQKIKSLGYDIAYETEDDMHFVRRDSGAPNTLTASRER